MRLIDADELKKKLKLWAFNNVTTTSPTFDFVTEFDINECPTVDVLEQIRDEIQKEKEAISFNLNEQKAKWTNSGIYDGLTWAQEIIDKYMK